jgi:hypothetical protein
MWTFALWEKCSSPYSEEYKAHLPYGEEDKHTNHKFYIDHIITGYKLPLPFW